MTQCIYKKELDITQTQIDDVYARLSTAIDNGTIDDVIDELNIEISDLQLRWMNLRFLLRYNLS